MENRIKCYLDVAPLIKMGLHGNTSKKEVCGGLLGINKADIGWIRIMEFDPWKNIGDKNAHVDYVPDRKDLYNTLRKTTHVTTNANRDFVGIFHTHPSVSPPIPSNTDIFGNGQESAKNSGYAGIYFIYSPGLDRFSGQYYDGENFGFKEVDIIVQGMESHATFFTARDFCTHLENKELDIKHKDTV